MAADLRKIVRLVRVTPRLCLVFFTVSVVGFGVAESALAQTSGQRYDPPADKTVISYRDGQHPSGRDVAGVEAWIIKRWEPASMVRDLRDELIADLDPPKPDPARSPRVGVPPVVQTDTWLWVENPWEPIRVSDSRTWSDELELSVSVIATPVHTTWEFSDGSIVSCPGGPGERWDSARPNRRTECGVKFSRSGQVRGSATTRWRLTWELWDNELGYTGFITRTQSMDVEVVEIQALER